MACITAGAAAIAAVLADSSTMAAISFFMIFSFVELISKELVSPARRRRVEHWINPKQGSRLYGDDRYRREDMILDHRERRQHAQAYRAVLRVAARRRGGIRMMMHHRRRHCRVQRTARADARWLYGDQQPEHCEQGHHGVANASHAPLYACARAGATLS